MTICTHDGLTGGSTMSSQICTWKNGVAFWSVPMKSWPEGGSQILVYIHPYTWQTRWVVLCFSRRTTKNYKLNYKISECLFQWLINDFMICQNSLIGKCLPISPVFQSRVRSLLRPQLEYIFITFNNESCSESFAIVYSVCIVAARDSMNKTVLLLLILIFCWHLHHMCPTN